MMCCVGKREIKIQAKKKRNAEMVKKFIFTVHGPWKKWIPKTRQVIRYSSLPFEAIYLTNDSIVLCPTVSWLV